MISPRTCVLRSRLSRPPREFFDGLAQFYRRAFLRWIDATRRRPEERERRIAEMIELLQRGERQRP